LGRKQGLASPDMTFPTQCPFILLMRTVALTLHDVGRAAIIVKLDPSQRKATLGRNY
jgi:hypothetical protein